MGREEFIGVLVKLTKIGKSDIDEYMEYLDKELNSAKVQKDGIRWVKLEHEHIEVSRDIYEEKEFYRVLIRV